MKTTLLAVCAASVYLLSAFKAHADPVVTIDHNGTDAAERDFHFKTVPAATPQCRHRRDRVRRGRQAGPRRGIARRAAQRRDALGRGPAAREFLLLGAGR